MDSQVNYDQEVEYPSQENNQPQNASQKVSTSKASSKHKLSASNLLEASVSKSGKKCNLMESELCNKDVQNCSSTLEERMIITTLPDTRIQKNQEPPIEILTETNSSNSGFFVYMDNAEGSQLISQMVPGNVVQSAEESPQIHTRQAIPSSGLSYFEGNILDVDKMRTSVNLGEQQMTVVFDPSIPQQHQQQIFIDSSSLVDLNQSVMIAPTGSLAVEKDGSQGLRQVLVTTHDIQEGSSDDKNYHTIIMTSEELNRGQSSNEMNFLPMSTVHWDQGENKTELPEQLNREDDKELEEMKEQQRQADLRSLEQSHLAHQTTLIQQRKNKESCIGIEEYLKNFGIDDITPIFSSITAKINPLIISHVPGCQQFLLKDGTSSGKGSAISVESTDEYSFHGNLTDLLALHNGVKSLMHLQSHTNANLKTVRSNGMEKENKGVYCNLLLPYVSSKGRISKPSMKAKQTETLMQVDDDLLLGDSVGFDEESSVKKTWKKKAAHSRHKKRTLSKKNSHSSTLKPQKEYPIGGVANSDVDKSVTLSAVEEKLAGEDNVFSDNPDLNDPLQVRLRQEQIKYRQIIHNTNKIRLLKSSLLESARKKSVDKDTSNQPTEKKSAEKKADKPEISPQRTTGRPPIYDLNEEFEEVNPRNPLTESEATKRQRMYENHIAFKFFCTQCSFKSKRKSHFESHLQCHQKYPEAHHKCKVCDFVSISLPTLRRHELKHKKNLLRCELCTAYKTDKRYLMQKHIRMRHSNSEEQPKYSCDQCAAEFSTSMGLTRHLVKHVKSLKEKAIENNKHACMQCKKDFRQRIHLRRHMRDVHGPNVRPHLCDKCGKSFKRADALQQHRLVHVARAARNLPYKCDECNKGFRSQSHLKEHMSMHSTERPFLCHFCGAAFKTQPVQKKHILTLHIRPRTHVCSICCRQFNTKHALMKHENTHKPPDGPIGDNDKAWQASSKDRSVKEGDYNNAEEVEDLATNVAKASETTVGRHPLTTALVVDVGSGTQVVLNQDNVRPGLSGILRLDPLMHHGTHSHTQGTEQ